MQHLQDLVVLTVVMQAQLSLLRQQQQETLEVATSAVLLGNISWPEAAVGANNSNTRVLA